MRYTWWQQPLLLSMGFYHLLGGWPCQMLLVFGNVLRIHQLCSNVKDIVKEIKLLLHRLIDQDYQLFQLTPLFQQAMDNAKAHLRCSTLDHLRVQSKKKEAHHRRVFLHLPYHPANPSSKVIQKLWASNMASPHGQTPLHQVPNKQGYDIPIERLTIAWHRLPNLSNLLSYRKLNYCMGLKVSSFLPKTS